MKHKILIAGLSAWLMACATSAPQKTAEKKAAPEKQAELEAPKPTYVEKVAAVNLSEFKAAAQCPADTKMPGVDWRKMVSAANACVKMKEWRRVEQIGQQLSIRAHLTPWGPYYLSLAAENRKDLPRAVWMMEMALKKAPNEGIFHYQLGRLHWQLEDETAAIKELKLASELNPSLVDAHYTMGLLALQREDLVEAERQLRKALAVEGRHFGATMALASVRMKKQDWASAVTSLEDAIRANPFSTKARMAMAQVQEQQLKQLARALQTYKTIRMLSSQRKLDTPVNLNLDEKIQMLEKSLAPVSKTNKVSTREPAEGKVAQ